MCSAPVDDVRYLCGESSVPPLILAVGVFPGAAAAVVVGCDDAVRKRVQGGVGGLDEQMDLLVAGPQGTSSP